MLTLRLSSVYLFIVILTTSLCSISSFAHTDDFNQATLSLDNNERYQLIVIVDFIHLLQEHLDISGEDNNVLLALNQLSFLEQKQLLENLEAVLSQQSGLVFSNKTKNIEQQQSMTFQGLQLQQLKRILAQPEKLTDYKIELHATGYIPENSDDVAVSFAPLLGNIVLKVVRPEQTLISAGALSQSFQINQSNALHLNSVKIPSTISLTMDYIYQGFVHILPRGLDHILFVLALLLFARKRSSLIWQISAFTLAHTITLALGIYGFVTISSTIVEPLIALSIVYVGLENIYRANQRTNSQARLPIIFAFGLLHGLGFASVLSEVGLPASQYLTSLISFNVGVELGQLTVIALAFICLYPFRKKVWYQTKLVLSLNITIALVASYWLIERLI